MIYQAFRRWSLAVLLALSSASAAEPHSGEPIVLGMSAPFSGPTADLGVNMRSGILAAIDEANRAGGVRGRALKLLAIDDGYEPARTVPVMRKLINEEKVVAIIGSVGTPTAVAAIPIINETQTPFWGAFTGAGILRKSPPDRYVINYRASYAEETEAMVDALIAHAHLQPTEIAFFTQRDAYGDAGFSGGLEALRRHGIEGEHAVSHVRYERNTIAVEKAVARLLLQKPPPKAVIMVGAYAPCAAFIKLARQSGLKALYLNVSFVGAEPLARELGADGDGVIVTQVVPHFNSPLPIAREYLAALKTHDPAAAPTFGSLEGYIAMRILAKALTSIEGAPTRETIAKALEGLGTFDIGLGETLELSREKHQACHKVWPTQIRSGAVVPFEWAALGSEAKP